ncbi:hypothetical protein EK0264_04695 [Epidermidibacterium keratini]|uniref:Uncharacterized protein n=1 Tax=Epidermidibacterium keratini TaxID=1891644 RepID=A0A7L4YKQ6_9ACTN|nr:hypothetical protein [Epidermidibacterium keratini]QHB99651.1 hypothetical protein EK0264_04695 [Epidermidibacterium keratini]
MTQAPTDAAEQVRSPGVIGWLSAVVWTFVCVLLNLLTIALVPLEVGTGFLVPISLLLVAIINLALPKVFARGVGIPWTRYLPAAIWIVLAVVAATPRSGGDLLLPSNSYSAAISLLYLGIGAMTAVIGVVLARTELSSFRRGATRPGDS